MISWITSDIDTICLAETWEHEESKVPNMEIRKNISPHIQLHKIDPLNQYIWIEISNTNAKKMYIAICYFAPINSTFYKKNNPDKNCPYNNLEKRYL